jgi:competence protein ComEC
MAIPARTGALAAAAGWTRAAAWAPDWRGAFSRALTREVEERRFFLWIPVAAMGGVALNLSADREPVLWLPALVIAVFATLAWFTRARPLALGLSLAIAALFAGFLSMSLRTARVAAPVLDRIRIVSLQGFVEEVDLRTVGARMVIGVVSADGMPQEKVPRRVRVTTRNTPDVAAGDYVALNLSADREPVMWLPALIIALFAALAWVSRARPLSLGLSLAIAALFAGFL